MTDKLNRNSQYDVERDISFFKLLQSEKSYKKTLTKVLKTYNPLIENEAKKSFRAFSVKFKHSSCCYEDFYQSAVEGFINSLGKYNPKLGVTFVHLAKYFISKGSIVIGIDNLRKTYKHNFR